MFANVLQSSVLTGIRRALRSALIRMLKARVAVSKLLMGDEGGYSAATYARMSGDFMRPSRPMQISPHVEIFSLYAKHGDALFDHEQFVHTGYYSNAVMALNTVGHYFEATDESGIAGVARRIVRRVWDGQSDTTCDSRNSHSHKSAPILLRPIVNTPLFQVRDGHHRVGAAIAKGCRTVQASVVGRPTSTPLLDLLEQVQWVGGRRELYQPVDAPEVVASYQLIRQCEDRLQRMLGFLRQHSTHMKGLSYLDVGCYFGWFVARMMQRGLVAHGVDCDPVALTVGRHVYGLSEQQVTAMDASRFLSQQSRETWDVVSCLSVLHHYVLGKHIMTAEDFAKLLDKVTRRVLFLDTGESHERWFARRLPGWNPAFIQDWLRRHTSFTEVLPLGADNDNLGRNVGNYGRMLFACYRRV